MKSIKILVTLAFAICLAEGPLLAAQKQAVKQTCCQKAAAAGKECRHKCCVAAHREGKSCEKCNPGKEDLKLTKNRAK